MHVEKKSPKRDARLCCHDGVAVAGREEGELAFGVRTSGDGKTEQGAGWDGIGWDCWLASHH